MWGVLFTYTLCTLCYLNEFRADMLVLESDILETRQLVIDMEQTLGDLTDEIESLEKEIIDLKSQIGQMQIHIEPKIIVQEPELPLSEEEIDLIALVTMAEAEAEPEEGQRLVIDSILNRVESDHSYWPDTVAEVVYQPSQFSAMWNGRVDRCRVTDEMVQLVKEELKSRTNTEVVYFRMYNYGPYGTPMFQVGNHYFSSL